MKYIAEKTMTHNKLKVIALIIMLSKSFILYASQHSEPNDTSRNISAPNFQDIKNEMKELLNQMIELNTKLTSAKVSRISNFKELSSKKLDICIKLKKDYIDPFNNKINKYRKANPETQLNTKNPYLLEKYVIEESIHTRISIENPNYVPDISLRCVKNGMYMKINPGYRNKEIDKLNKELGGKVFLKTIDYINRSDTPSERLPCGYEKEIRKEYSKGHLLDI
jgi:hypothetical protein